MNYIFFLPDGPTLGGVEVWSFAMVRALNKVSPGCAKIISLVSTENADTQRKYPEDLKDFSHEVILDLRQLVQQEYIDMAIGRIQGIISDEKSYIFPNYGSHSYSLAAGLKVRGSGKYSVVATLHSDDSHNYSLARYYSPFIDRYIAVSSQIAQNFQSSMPWRQNDLLTRPCGVENLPHPKVKTNKFSDRSVLRLAYVGRLATRQKRILDLVSAVEQLEKKSVNCQIDILGEGPEKDNLERQVEKINPKSVKVLFHGKKNRAEVLETLQQSHVFCSFSAYEGTSISLMEALGSGCIPLVTDVSGVRDLISEDKFIFKVGDITTFVSKLQKISSMSEEQCLSNVQNLSQQVQGNSMEHYITWFLGHFRDFSLQPVIRLSEMHRNWDFTWNPAIFHLEQAHPLFAMYEGLKAKWYGRFAISIVQRLLRLLR